MNYVNFNFGDEYDKFMTCQVKERSDKYFRKKVLTPLLKNSVARVVSTG